MSISCAFTPRDAEDNSKNLFALVEFRYGLSSIKSDWFILLSTVYVSIEHRWSSTKNEKKVQWNLESSSGSRWKWSKKNKESTRVEKTVFMQFDSIWAFHKLLLAFFSYAQTRTDFLCLSLWWHAVEEKNVLCSYVRRIFQSPVRDLVAFESPNCFKLELTFLLSNLSSTGALFHHAMLSCKQTKPDSTKVS